MPRRRARSGPRRRRMRSCRRTGFRRSTTPVERWPRCRRGAGVGDPAVDERRAHVRGGRRRERAPTRGLRLPAVLGDRRQPHHARLADALDGRVLQRRLPAIRRAATSTTPDGSATTGWGGWTSSKMTSIINAAHQNHDARRPDDLVLRLEQRRRDAPGQAPRQRDRPVHPGEGRRGRRPGSRRGRNQPRLRADRGRLCRRVHRARAVDPDRARPDPRRATS